MLALTLAKEKKTMDEGQYLAIVKELGHIPDKMKEVLKLNDRIAAVSYTHLDVYKRQSHASASAVEHATLGTLGTLRAALSLGKCSSKMVR